MDGRRLIVWIDRLGRLLDLIILAANTAKSDRVEVTIPLSGTVAPWWTVSTNCLC